jgi:hypothetical protein
VECRRPGNTVPAPLELTGVFTEFHVPIGEIHEVFPTVVLLQAQADLHEGTPFWPLRFADKLQPGFVRTAVGFVRIALDAGADNIFPSGGPAAIARDDVIEVQIFALEHFTTVLAGVLVALKNVVPGELHFLFRKMIKDRQQYHAWDADAKRDGADRFRMRFVLRELMPLGKTEGAEGTVVAIEDSLGLTLKEQSQRASRGANIYRLPKPIQN